MARTTVFQRLLKKSTPQGLARRSTEAYSWARRHAKKARVTPRTLLAQEQKQKDNKGFDYIQTLRGRMMLGNMYFFFYDPKLSESLSYYDTFPLVIPIETYADGFLGINFHYLPHRLRAILLDHLLDLQVTPTESNNQKKLSEEKIGYDKLSHFNRYKYFKPCLKRYLYSQVRSRYLQVEMDDWSNAIFLPVERFFGQRANVVWDDSRREVKRKRMDR